MDFLPTPEQIAEMIQNAVIAIVPGTLEEVVSAWRNLDKLDRANYPLLIGEHWLNYSDAFANIFLSKQVVDVPWTGYIIWGYVTIKSGKVNGVYFLQTMKKFPLGNEFSAIHFTKKASLNIPFDFTNADVRSNIFWHGGAPVILKDRYVLEPPNHAHQFIHLAPVEGETRGQVS
ncbi:MAG: hypothetical protein A2Z94_05450 [Gallionellales bacterium GWA2_55_18]|nr:MAG: hypothetical protein A2Z94_05450 [Gallionellales bacterium GWA2_55_18]